MFEELQKERSRFGSLECGLALWLLWRRSQKRPVTAPWVAGHVSGVTVPMIENFFSTKYGIGRIDKSKLNLKALCELYKVDLISDEEAAQMIQEYEDQYGEMADADGFKKRSKV